MSDIQIKNYIKQIVLPSPDSHKGDNGRVLVIGGSKLFHAAAFWSAAMASKIVDMVHFSSPAIENNELMRVRAKEKFWEGIVVAWEEVEHYIAEDDVILIGPGMERGLETKRIVDSLLAKYPNKRWVVDGGALQMVNPELIKPSMIVTPNYREYNLIQGRLSPQVVILRKGEKDLVIQGLDIFEVEGGNAGMTKGGSGDVLAGLVTALYAKSPGFASAVVGSYVNKRAGNRLHERVSVFFAAADLIPEVSQVLATILSGDSRKEN